MAWRKAVIRSLQSPALQNAKPGIAFRKRTIWYTLVIL
jgi:hypothetical protein